MKTIALRFGEHFSPECGTIAAHQAIIDQLGYVWYGKMGNPIAASVMQELLSQKNAKILLISSGKADRYWARVTDISRSVPNKEGIPLYYRDKADSFRTWFKVIRFERAPRDIMAKCVVVSSGAPLGSVSRHSMSPYFIIECSE